MPVPVCDVQVRLLCRAPMRRTIRAHPALASTTALAVVAWGAYGLARGSPLALPYLVELAVLATFVGWLDSRHPFRRATLAGLSLWAVLHMAGGMLDIEGVTLYETWLLPVLRWDQLVHAVGFGFGGVAVFEAFQPWLGSDSGPAAAAWVAFMGSNGIGAVNEVVEFIASRLLTFANVGDEVNTGLDLIANAVGGAIAAWVCHRRVTRDLQLRHEVGSDR